MARRDVSPQRTSPVGGAQPDGDPMFDPRWVIRLGQAVRGAGPLLEAAMLGATGLVAMGSGIAASLATRARYPGAFDMLGPDRYLVAIGMGLVVSACHHAWSTRRASLGPREASAGAGEAARRALAVLATLVGYALLIQLVGYLLATVAFLSATFVLYGVSPAHRAITLGLGIGTVFWGLVRIAGMPFPGGLLFR